MTRSDHSQVPQAASGSLTWGLCVATLNRLEALEQCVLAARDQTRPPVQVVIVDASSTWEAHRDRIAARLGNSGVRLVHVGSPRKSSAVQRNVGLSLLEADVAFLIDDDSMMSPTCAEEVMAVYEADSSALVAAVAALNTGGDTPPAGSEDVARKASPVPGRGIGRALLETGFGRWFRREILMMATDRMFVKYDRAEDHFGPADFARLGRPDLEHTQFIGGCVMTVRREVALREPFDSHLLAYSPTEDLDASYRYTRHGLNVVARNARLAHLEASAGRIRRRKATMLALMNSAYFTRRSSDRPLYHALAYYVLSLRRLLAEFLKDLLSRRLSFPQFRGALGGIVRSPRIFLHSRDGLGEWYERLQSNVLSD